MNSLHTTGASVPTTINFHDQPIVTFEKNNEIYVALKPVCEQMGLSWKPQRKLIARDLVLKQVASIMEVTSKGKDGKLYNVEMVCLPLQYLNGWLFKINAARYKDFHRRELIILYQKECYQALYNYWHKGVATKLSSEILIEKAFQLIEDYKVELAHLRREREQQTKQVASIGSKCNPIVIDYDGRLGDNVRLIYKGYHVKLISRSESRGQS